MSFALRALLILAFGCVDIACSSHSSPGKREIAIAAAANLTAVFQRIGPDFEAQTGIHPVFSYASTAQLTHQIENGAPFDVFTAADSVHVAELETGGLLMSGTRAVYATGILELWFPSGNFGRVEDLTDPKVRTIAIAKPELAPYGQAAVDTLRKSGMWDKVQPKIVYAENISAAKQYGSSGNADAVFTAKSLVLKESGKTIDVDEALHRPIHQELAIIANTKNEDAARRFVEYLKTGQGRQTLLESGYR